MLIQYPRTCVTSGIVRLSIGGGQVARIGCPGQRMIRYSAVGVDKWDPGGCPRFAPVSPPGGDSGKMRGTLQSFHIAMIWPHRWRSPRPGPGAAAATTAPRTDLRKQPWTLTLGVRGRGERAKRAGEEEYGSLRYGFAFASLRRWQPPGLPPRRCRRFAPPSTRWWRAPSAPSSPKLRSLALASLGLGAAAASESLVKGKRASAQG